MTVILVILICICAIGAGTALVRGLMAFANDARDLRSGDPSRVASFGIKQNRMMSQRVLFQGLAIALVALIGALAGQS